MLRRLRVFAPVVQVRQCSSSSSVLPSNEEIVPMVMNNRNPRNLERIRIAYKPLGYDMDKPGKRFWHKLHVKCTSRHVLAYIQHFQNGTVIEASTNEWAIKKHLYKTTDTTAYINLGRILADRCLMMGITEVMCFINTENSTKMKLFLDEMEKGGVSLKEPDIFKTPLPLDEKKEEKPWEIFEQ